MGLYKMHQFLEQATMKSVDDATKVVDMLLSIAMYIYVYLPKNLVLVAEISVMVPVLRLTQNNFMFIPNNWSE